MTQIRIFTGNDERTLTTRVNGYLATVPRDCIKDFKFCTAMCPIEGDTAERVFNTEFSVMLIVDM